MEKEQQRQRYEEDMLGHIYEEMKTKELEEKAQNSNISPASLNPNPPQKKRFRGSGPCNSCLNCHPWGEQAAATCSCCPCRRGFEDSDEDN